MDINKLSANHDKTKILVMKHGREDTEISFQIGEFLIKESKKEKLLGMIVSNQLNWCDHISKLENELRFRLFTLRRIEQVVPKTLLKKVADGIFCSILRYGLGIFCPMRMNENDPNSTLIDGIKVTFHDVLRLLWRLSGSKKLKTNFKSKKRESSFHYQSVRLWNSAPLEIINAETQSEAKKSIREYVLTLPI